MIAVELAHESVTLTSFLGLFSLQGALLKETQAINKSLSALSNVIESLQAGDSHIKFRDSKLTFLLRNSLTGDSKTLAIICCSPLDTNYNETLSSLRFAEKANKVELKKLSTKQV